MATAEQRLAAAEAKAKAAAEKAAAAERRAAALKKQIEEKKQLVANRGFAAQQKTWGRRPRETHQKILAGVAVLCVLRSSTNENKNKLQKLLLSQLTEKDRAPLLELVEFQD